MQQDFVEGKTYMRNARWLASLGHVLAQVSCAIANSYLAAVARGVRKIGLKRDKRVENLLLEVSYHGLLPISSGNHPLVPPADRFMIR